MTPASPWIGSTRKATVFGVIACFQRLGVAEGHDPEARRERPEMPARASGSVEKPTMPRVRPWKLSAQTMISACPSGTPFTS